MGDLLRLLLSKADLGAEIEIPFDDLPALGLVPVALSAALLGLGEFVGDINAGRYEIDDLSVDLLDLVPKFFG